jgi:hypothetical protein
MTDLERLRALLQTSDLQALEVHAQLHQAHAAAAGAALAPLAANIAAFDFSQAMVECEALVRKFSPPT